MSRSMTHCICRFEILGPNGKPFVLRATVRSNTPKAERDTLCGRLKQEFGPTIGVEIVEGPPSSEAGNPRRLASCKDCGGALPAGASLKARVRRYLSFQSLPEGIFSEELLPSPPDLPGTRVVRPVLVLEVCGVRPSSQIVYPAPVRKALTFIGQEGFRWTFAKIRSKIFYKRIAAQAVIVVVVGRCIKTNQWVVAYGQQFARQLPMMLFRNELIVPAMDAEKALLIAKEMSEVIESDAILAGNLAGFSSYSREIPPPVPWKHLPLTECISRPLGEGTPGVMPKVSTAVPAGRSLILVGAGDYAFTFALPHLLSHRFDTVVDYNPITARMVATRYGFADAETDYKRVLRHAASMDQLTVVIAGYHSQHTEIAVSFLEANPRACVMIEKPPAVGYSQLRQLLPYFMDQRKFVEVGFNRRYSSMIRKTKSLLANRTKPVIITCIVREDNMEPSHWYFWKSEGTRIYGNLCHWIDLGVHLIAAKPVEVVVLSGSDFQMASGVHVRFEDDSLLILSSSTVGSGLRGVQEFIDVRTGELTIQIHDFRKMVIQTDKGHEVLSGQTRDKGHREMYRCLARNIQEGRRPEYVARDLIHVTTIAEEALEMLKGGERCRSIHMNLEGMPSDLIACDDRNRCNCGGVDGRAR